MRVLVIGVLAVAMTGCGGSEGGPAPAGNAVAAHPEAPEVVYLYRVQGDDPLPDSVSLRADGTADVRRGGGHSGFRSMEVALSRSDAAKSMRLVAAAPWKALDGHTVTPGGFNGWNNDMRYMLRRGKRSITVTAAHMPHSIWPLIRDLNAIIEGGTGRTLSSELHSAASATIAP